MSQVASDSKTSNKLTQFRSEWLVAVGSNETFGAISPLETIQLGVAKLSASGQVIRKMSAYYRTSAFPPGSGPDFVNAAFVLEGGKDAQAILQILHNVEAECGRERVQRWGQRTLDLDLIGQGNSVIPDRATVQRWMDLPLEDQTKHAPGELLLPHPRVQDRAFVLVPLMDVAPDWEHPLTGQSVREMLQALPKADRDGVKPLVNQGEQT